MMPSSQMSSAHRRNCPIADRAVWLLAALLLMVIPVVQADEKLGHTLTPVEPPVQAPVFSLQDMDGEEIGLSGFRGRVVLLNFWATWCPPCRREMPSMERLYQDLREQPFSVVAINEYEDADHVFAYLGQLDTDPSFTILFDPDSAVAEAYGVRGLPSTFLIDRHGRIRYRAIGGREFDHPQVITLIERLLAEQY